MKSIPLHLDQAVEILQRLIQFDTTNPPGNETACINYISELLNEIGIETKILGKNPNRPNLIARIKGTGKAAPLLLYGHVDVVTTENQNWKHPPFSGLIAEECIWGRGTLDMKGGVVMMLTAFMNLKKAKHIPAGDIVLAIVSDEEVGGEYGAQYLVENHADLFEGIKYAIGEFGGFPIYIGGKKFNVIQVAEKQVCWMKGTIHGTGGHASLPTRGGTVAKLAKVLHALNDNRLPVHIHPVVKEMLEIIVSNTEEPYRSLFSELAISNTTDSALDKMGDSGKIFDAILHNTVNVTVINGGNKTNVIPSEITIQLDGRLLPGFKPKDLIKEILSITSDDLELEVFLHHAGPQNVDSSMFSFFSGILKEMDPEGIPIPLLLTGATDGRHFSKLGIQTYGFLPMNLPPDFDMMSLIHAANERIPIASFQFGIRAIQKALINYI